MLSFTKSFTFRAAALATASLGSAAVLTATTAAAQPAPERGALISARPVARVSAATIRHDLRKLGISAAGVNDGVLAERIVYRTIGTRGKPVRASGLVVLPQHHTATLTTVVYDHGTQSARRDAPSEPTGNDGFVSGLILGAHGLAAIAPDYLGLGTGPGLHPYLDVSSEVTASVDMLRAARTYVARTGSALSRRVDITGFSQGGAAAVGLGRELQRRHDGGFRLGGLAPISGPYDLRGSEFPAVLAGKLNPEVVPFYVGYVLDAWQRIDHPFPSLASVVRAPYAERLPGLYDGSHDVPAIAKALPRTLPELLTPEGLAELHSPSGAFARVLGRSEVCRSWTPRVPVHLFAARGDDVVAFANAQACDRDLKRSGANVTLTDVGDVDHDHSAYLAVPRVARMFAGR